MGMKKVLAELLVLLGVVYYNIQDAQGALPTAATKVVEIFVYSAPDLFRFHKQQLSLTKAETEAFLRTWEKALIRDVGIIFRNIVGTDMRLYYVGGAGDSDLTQAWYADNTDGTWMRKQAVDDVAVFLANKVANNEIPAYDHAVVLTRENLADDFAGNNFDFIAYSNGDTICTNTDGSSVGLAEVSSPLFNKAIAQSILFGFGMPYITIDESYFPMSFYFNTFVKADSRSDPWFLETSTDALLATRVTNNGACLANTLSDADWIAYLGTPTYGATYTLTEQCANLYGNGSTDCAVRIKRICFDGMTCTTPGTTDCDLPIMYGDRTPCEGTSSCRDGLCGFNAVTTPSPTTSSSTSTTTIAPTTTTIAPTTTTPVATTTTTVGETDCCCERRPLGKVVITMEYVPCNGTSTPSP